MAESNFSWLSFYGAITGTVALILNLRQWWHDRANIKVDADISITNTDINGNIQPVQFVVLCVTVVNIGHRSASIKSISVPLTKDSMPIPQGATPEIIESMRQYHIGGQLILFGGRDEEPIELKQDGGNFKIKGELKKHIPILPNEDDNKLGTVLVELTS